jgi:hypothetical protein
MAHHEDDPSTSCIIKQEPEGEGIYASAACFETRDPKTDQGLTLPPKIQSNDPWPFNAARSLANDEIDALLGIGQVDLPEREPRRDDSWVLTLFQHEYQLPGLPRKKRRLTDLPAPGSNQEGRSVSRTPSVSAPYSTKNTAKASQKPAQSNCLASISQTPTRSETPQTPSDRGNEIAVPDPSSNGEQGQARPDRDQQQYTLPTDANLLRSQNFSAGGSLHTEEKHARETPAVREVTKDPKQVSPIPLSSGADDRAKPAQSMTTWDADTPIPSIESNSHQNPIPTISARKPFSNASQLSENSKAKSGVCRDVSSASVEVEEQRSRTQANLAKKSECDQQRKRASSACTTTSHTNRLDHTTSQLFSTFMKLRNSLPISAIMAMLLPPQRKEVLQTLAELFNVQNWISRSGVTHSVVHELPEDLRALLNQLKGKFKTDEQFRKSVILFIVEELKTSSESPFLSILLLLIKLPGEAKGVRNVKMDDILQIGIDQLRSFNESKEQLLYERKHYHGLLVDMDGEITVQKERIQQLETELRAIRGIIGNNPHSTSNAPNASSQSPPGMVQLELENNAPKHNPFWVCCLMLLDGSGVQCHGINREWHQLHKPGRTDKWTQRRLCFRCGRTNKSNRKYISDIEAKMLGGVTKSGRINPYGNQAHTSQQGSSRQTPSQPTQHPHFISPTPKAKNQKPAYIAHPPVNILQPVPAPLIIPPTVNNSPAPHMGYPPVNIPQPSELQPTSYNALPVIFTGNSFQPVQPANIPIMQARTATMGALGFPATTQETGAKSYQPVQPASIPKMQVRTATMGALSFPATAPESPASPAKINSPSLDISDPEQVDFSQWMGITTTQNNNMSNHLQASQQMYSIGTNILPQTSQPFQGNGTTSHHLQASHQIYTNNTYNQTFAGKKRSAATPPKSDPPSPKKAKLHSGFNVTNSTQEYLRHQLQEVQKPWMSSDFNQTENHDESSQSDNDSLFGEEQDDAASTPEGLSSLFADDEGADTQTSESTTTVFEAQVDLSQEPGSASTGDKKSDYERDCELFGEKYANERREKVTLKAAEKEASPSRDYEDDFEADLWAALDAETGH